MPGCGAHLTAQQHGSPAHSLPGKLSYRHTQGPWGCWEIASPCSFSNVTPPGLCLACEVPLILYKGFSKVLSQLPYESGRNHMPLSFLESFCVQFNPLTGSGPTCRIWKKRPLIYSIRVPNFVLHMTDS